MRRVPSVAFVLVGVLAALTMVGQSTPRAAASAISPGPAVAWRVSSEVVGSPAITSADRPVWRALLLIYHRTNLDYLDEQGTLRHITAQLDDAETATALNSFQRFASIAHAFSDGEAVVQYDVVHVYRPVTSVTRMDPSNNWLSPSDTQPELDAYAPPGRYDSIFVHWMRCDQTMTQCVPSSGFGWGLQPTDWAHGSTYATAHSAPASLWNKPTVGEVWLHEWLHGVSAFYKDRGFALPSQDADGGGSHGYVESQTDGWAGYYRDLMTGKVPEAGVLKGIAPAAWRSGTIIGQRRRVRIDYFRDDTTSQYARSGSAAWQAGAEDIRLGGEAASDNRLDAIAQLGGGFVATGRVMVPPGSVGPWDSVSLAVRGSDRQYWVQLGYGRDLAEVDKVALVLNETVLQQSSLALGPGWYTVKVQVGGHPATLRAKAWPDTANEPDWLVSDSLPSSWLTEAVGFRHYGVGTEVDDLFIEQNPNRVYLPLTVRP